VEKILEVRGLNKRFGSVLANNNVDLDVYRGTIHSIIGENGAGKSTLMNIISGLLQPDSGTITFQGKYVKFINANQASRQGIGMVHQEFMLYPTLTVLNNIILGHEPIHFGCFVDVREAREQVKKICNYYHFDLPLDSQIQDLPVSVRQQVEIVKTLYRGAELIIFDEPTAVLTPSGIEGLFSAMRFLVSQNKSIIFITHKLKEVLDISDRITVMRDGCIVGNVVPTQTNEAELASLMVGREVMLTVDVPPMNPGSRVMQVSNLCVTNSEGIEKIHGLDFEVQEGEILGIAGVAGNGQKELAESLFGLRKVLHGKIIFSGQDITELGPREKRKLGIGYIPQDRLGLATNISASLWENAIMGYHIRGDISDSKILNKRLAYSFSESVLKSFSVKSASLFDRVGTLSGGNIQKLVVGRELSQDYQFLLIEDPTRGIDVGNIEFIWARLLEAASHGISILLISHDLNEVLSLSTRGLGLYEGRLTAEFKGPRYDEKKIGLAMLGGLEAAEGV
jgi:simple sugar transport system ATP-binding protein